MTLFIFVIEAGYSKYEMHEHRKIAEIKQFCFFLGIKLLLEDCVHLPRSIVNHVAVMDCI